YFINPNEVKASRKEEYDRLVIKLKNNFKAEIYTVIERIKIFRKINKDKLYVEGGFKSFREFLYKLKFAKTQIYKYIRLAIAIESGLIEEGYIISNGVQAAIDYIKTNKNVSISNKLNEENLIKPLILRFKDKESYDFYKENIKFTEFFLQSIFLNEKDLIEKFKNKFNNQ
ncbi:chromosome replication/partitioning protein, partial [Borreliella americana]|uniref:chromosome replication/partitioning protein n=1 Tax=Borreliella americana TaxID=478807 RepID=UPI001E2F66A7